MEYIESELARRQNRTQVSKETTASSQLSQANDSFSNAFSKREPATLGKLHEIDLGQETKLQNIARTEAATRRMAGESSDVTGEAGRNGKPWRNRRRNNEDIERDRLVEEVLRESKCECSIGVCRFINELLLMDDLYQWMCTTSRSNLQCMMTWLRTIVLRNNFDAILWKLSRPDAGRSVIVLPQLPRAVGLLNLNPLADRNWVGAGALVLQCGRCKRRVARNNRWSLQRDNYYDLRRIYCTDSIGEAVPCYLLNESGLSM